MIINSAELEKYFGKDKSPREMKDKIMSLLDEWKAKQPPELGKPDKKKGMEMCVALLTTSGQFVPRRWRKAKGQRSLRALAFPVSPTDNGNTDRRLFYCHERSALWPKQLAEKNIHTKSEKSHSLSRLSTKTRASLCVTFF